jgi:hypothetical protein
MDGGGLALNKGNPVTVWNRKGIIYASEPGKEEKELGRGRGCTMKAINGKNVYAWIENGEVVVLKPSGKKMVLGKGSQPMLEHAGNNQIICVWENDKQINSSLIYL